jgi:hypothetical protein
VAGVLDADLGEAGGSSPTAGLQLRLDGVQQPVEVGLPGDPAGGQRPAGAGRRPGGRTGRCTTSRATGQPMCDRCRERWIVCSRCGVGASLKGGTLDEPLCARCVNPDPAFWTRCGVCGITWQLTTAECARCCLDRKLSQILTTADGTTAPQLDQLRQTLVQVDRPDHALDWLNKPGVRDTLSTVALARPAITHEAGALVRRYAHPPTRSATRRLDRRGRRGGVTRHPQSSPLV